MNQILCRVIANYDLSSRSGLNTSRSIVFQKQLFRVDQPGTSLEAFKRLHKLPIWFRRFIKNSFFNSARKLLDGLVKQDVEMIEEEQQAYLKNPQRRGYELNPALGKVQKFMRKMGHREWGRADAQTRGRADTENGDAQTRRRADAQTRGMGNGE